MRIALFATAVALLATSAVAQPHKQAPRETPPLQHPVPLILAAAETPHSPETDTAQQNQAPAKRPVGRITNCRCGDPQPADQTPER